MKQFRPNMAGFSILEVLIGIFIFSLGLISIYALLSSSLRVDAYNKHAFISGNLAREQIELIRNIRDTNYAKLQIWNKKDPNTSGFAATDLFADGEYYKVFYDFDSGNIDVAEIGDFGEGESELAGKMQDYRLCRDDENNYIYCSTAPGSQQTPYYRYLFIEEYNEDALILHSNVIWYVNGYHNFDIKTIITDWRRI